MLSEVIYDGKLSGTAYAVLFIALLLIVGGLGWCFYRALKAAGEREGAERVDDVRTPGG